MPKQTTRDDLALLRASIVHVKGYNPYCTLPRKSEKSPPPVWDIFSDLKNDEAKKNKDPSITKMSDEAPIVDSHGGLEQKKGARPFNSTNNCASLDQGSEKKNTGKCDSTPKIRLRRRTPLAYALVTALALHAAAALSPYHTPRHTSGLAHSLSRAMRSKTSQASSFRTYAVTTGFDDTSELLSSRSGFSYVSRASNAVKGVVKWFRTLGLSNSVTLSRSRSATSSCEYNQKGALYDQFRTPFPGWETMEPRLDEINMAGKKMLDSGCGTGAFFEPMLGKGLSELHAYDPSESMISEALNKVAKFPSCDRSKMKLSVAWSSSHYPDNYFDVVTSLQVVQNLVPEDPRESSEARAGYLREMFRVLKPGGVAMVATRYRLQGERSSSSTSSYGDMYWYSDETITPRAVSFMEHAVPQDPVSELEDVGFIDCELKNSPKTILMQDAYDDVTQNLVSNPSFQAGDSFFSRLDADEKKALETHIQGLIDRNEFAAYKEKRDKLRGDKGQIGVCFATKPTVEKEMDEIDLALSQYKV